MIDKAFVLNEGPWAFNGKILLLKEITGAEVPSEVSFTMARLFVKACDLPAKKQTVAFAQCLGNKLGTFSSCEADTMFGVDKSVCFMVDIDVTKPPVRVVNVLSMKAPLWMKLKYVKLSNFCYGCGCLGHVLRGCDTIDSNIEEDLLQYGD